MKHLKRFLKGLFVVAMIPGSMLGAIALNRYLVAHTGADLITWSTLGVLSLAGIYGIGYMMERRR